MRVFAPRFRKALIVLGLLLAAYQQWSEATGLAHIREALKAAPLPLDARDSILARIDADPRSFQGYLAQALAERESDPMLFRLVDKAKALPEGYVPGDLQALDGSGLSVARSGLRLRKAALQALEAMDSAARLDGITLLAASCYRSYAYQAEVWDRSVKADGLAETESGLALPGHSQHQLGTALDFGPISDVFAETKASRWLSAKARSFGFSLSYPKGMTGITGYRWESWHYRYIGKAAAAIEGEYFGGVQQYLLTFLETM
jgi:D-alanyl-D-alanine carboxypeptidase